MGFLLNRNINKLNAPQEVSKGENAGKVRIQYPCAFSPLVVGRVRETYETFPGGSLHTFSPVRKYDCARNREGVLPCRIAATFSIIAHLIRHGIAVTPSPQGEGFRTSNARPYK